MAHGRYYGYYHSCGTFQLEDGNIILVAAGGVGGSQISTEILQFESHSWSDNWENGPDLIEPCWYSSMVTSPDGQGVILLGCYPNRESLYELRKNNDGILAWTKLPQKLKYPRESTLAMLIPDEMASCTNFSMAFL